MLRLDGHAVAQIRRESLKNTVSAFIGANGRAPGLAVILVGEDPASHVYVSNKIKACAAVGIESFETRLDKTVSEPELFKKLEALNRDIKVDGILVQLPLPKHLSEDRVIDMILPNKDADGLTTANQGLLWVGKRRVAPCTPWGVMKILEHYKVSLVGKNAVVIGRSRIVGRPMAHLLTEANATVTVCHSKTRDLRAWTSQADLVVVAAGKPRFLGKEDFKRDAVVVDVGMHRLPDGKLCGDVRLEELEDWANAATPVPRGVGPMTIQMLLENTVDLAQQSIRGL